MVATATKAKPKAKPKARARASVKLSQSAVDKLNLVTKVTRVWDSTVPGFTASPSSGPTARR